MQYWQALITYVDVTEHIAEVYTNPATMRSQPLKDSFNDDKRVQYLVIVTLMQNVNNSYEVIHADTRYCTL